MEQNGTGIEYPTIELGGKVYTVKFSRAALYDMQKRGVAFNPQFALNAEHPELSTVKMDFAQIVDVLHVCIQFKGSHQELAELVYDKRDEAAIAILAARGKAFPPPQTIPLRETAGQDLPKQ